MSPRAGLPVIAPHVWEQHRFETASRQINLQLK